MTEEKAITVGDVADKLRMCNCNHKIRFCVNSRRGDENNIPERRDENNIPERSIYLQVDSVEFYGEYCYIDFVRIS